MSCPHYNPSSNTVTMQVKNVFEKLSPQEETQLLQRQDDHPYQQRKLTLSEFVYKRCEDIRQPMKDEEGPVQLWLAQHGPIRMRRRPLEEVLSEEELHQHRNQQRTEDPEESETEEDDEEEESEESQQQKEAAARKAAEDQLPKIATKANASHHLKHLTANNNSNVNSANGRHYGGSHLPASMNPLLKNQKRRKILSRPMGLEAELPYGCEVRASHDGQGNAKAELDILMVERTSGIAYRTGYKVVYSRERERSEWVVEVVG